MTDRNALKKYRSMRARNELHLSSTRRSITSENAESFIVRSYRMHESRPQLPSFWTPRALCPVLQPSKLATFALSVNKLRAVPRRAPRSRRIWKPPRLERQGGGGAVGGPPRPAEPRRPAPRPRAPSTAGWWTLLAPTARGQPAEG